MKKDTICIYSERDTYLMLRDFSFYRTITFNKNKNIWKYLLYIQQKGEKIMVEQDTIKLLRETDAGIKMGVSSINDVLEYTNDEKLKKLLSECKEKHEELNDEIKEILDEFGDEGKEPNPIAKGMSWMKTNMKLSMEESDRTVADLITDGCNMGVKSLNKYLNQYEAADEKSKDITKHLINLEEKLAIDIRSFL